MLKGLILISLIAFSISFEFFGHKFFENKINQDNFHVEDSVQKGNLITPQIQAQIKNISEQAFIFNGNNSAKNVLFIQQQLSNLYSGSYVVGIYGSYGATNSTIDPILGTNMGISSYSAQGQWWIYWKGVNHYQPNQAYYISRLEGNTTNYTCFSNNNYTYSSDVYANVVQAAEVDFHDIQNFTAQVQTYLHGFSSDLFPTVSAVNTTLSFFLCAWGASNYNVIQRTAKQNLMIVSTPRVG